MKIKNKTIGKNSPCFIIAEAGVNHNGSLKLAKKMVDAAKKAGVDAVKFQTFKAEDLVTKNHSQFKVLKSLELDYKDFSELKKYCDKKKIIFLSTPHSEQSLDFLDSLMPAFKIASGDINNLPFLEKVAKKGKPIILSTGMAYMQEIKEAVDYIGQKGNNKIILLHCTTSYPCQLKDANLKVILKLKKIFNFPIGYSDHTLGILAPVIAKTLGTEVIEKHFTLNKNLPGPDHKSSSEPKELKEMVKAVRDAEIALGKEIKKPTKKEQKLRLKVRKSIVAKIDILKGSKIEKEMLTIKRPGTGIEPKFIGNLIGKKAKKKILKDSLIKFKDLK